MFKIKNDKSIIPVVIQEAWRFIYRMETARMWKITQPFFP